MYYHEGLFVWATTFEKQLWLVVGEKQLWLVDGEKEVTRSSC
jgi:hypothetical protein